MHKFLKVCPNDVTTDREYQRELNESRIKRMATDLDTNRLGVPVLSLRANGEKVVLDGQHRFFALVMAERGHVPILCEVHEGLTKSGEADLFLKLNGDRRAVRVYDKWRARIVAEERIAHEITEILKSLGLRIANTSAKNCVCAIQVVEGIHVRNGNLKNTLWICKQWSDGVTYSAFDGEIIKAISFFLKDYEDVDAKELIARLEPLAPERVLSRIKRAYGADPGVSRADAASSVFREIYNQRNRRKLKARAAQSCDVRDGGGQ